jgi:predicted AlkP superfamily pyrophosphatase or phosphodiesterase
MRCVKIVLLGIGLLSQSTVCLHAAGRAKYFILVVWDGMRPDFVSQDLTPTLWQLREAGVWFARHHSSFPTSTEVNGTVLATGLYPQHSGVTANREYRAAIDPLAPFDTESIKAIRRADQISGGQYLSAPTVTELVRKNGGRTAVVGAKPVALLHDRLDRNSETAGLVWFADGALPNSIASGLTRRFGPFPKPVSPNVPRDQWAVECLTQAFWQPAMPRYSVLWLSEPDYSQHKHGPGSPEALAAIRNCDQRLATVMQELDRRGIRAQTDVMVVSDHGFSWINRNTDVAADLRAVGINARETWTNAPQAGDVVTVGNGGSVMLYVIGHSPEVIRKVVATLQQQPASGVIFTRDGLFGTFPMSEARFAAPTAPDVVVVSSWKMEPASDRHQHVEVINDGYSQYRSGEGMHVTLSPTDLHNLGVASGPDFLRGVQDTLPTGNIDIVPTLLWLMNIKPPETLDGRVLSEALAGDGPELHGAKLGCDRATVQIGGGTWSQYLKFADVGGVRYLEAGNGQWHPKPASAAK